MNCDDADLGVVRPGYGDGVGASSRLYPGGGYGDGRDQRGPGYYNDSTGPDTDTIA